MVVNRWAASAGRPLDVGAAPNESGVKWHRLPIPSDLSQRSVHAPTDVARQAYAAFGTGDIVSFGELLAPETVWHINDVKPVNGDYQGVDGVFGFFGSLLEVSGGPFVIDVREYMGNDSPAEVLIHQTAQRDGKAPSVTPRTSSSCWR